MLPFAPFLPYLFAFSWSTKLKYVLRKGKKIEQKMHQKSAFSFIGVAS